MSNRKKPRHLKTVHPTGVQKLDIPREEQVVLKRVPAKIRWADVEGVDRTDVEIIGETVIFEDGTYDLIVGDDLSDDAKSMIYGFVDKMDSYSIGEEN